MTQPLKKLFPHVQNRGSLILWAFVESMWKLNEEMSRMLSHLSIATSLPHKNSQNTVFVLCFLSVAFYGSWQCGCNSSAFSCEDNDIIIFITHRIQNSL